MKRFKKGQIVRVEGFKELGIIVKHIEGLMEGHSSIVKIEGKELHLLNEIITLNKEE